MAGQHAQAQHGFGWTSWPKWQQALFVIGPTAAIALYLVFSLDSKLFTVVERVEARIESHAMKTELSDAEQVAAAAAILKATEAERLQNAANFRVLISIARQTCVNTARNDDARTRCLQ